MSVRVVCPHCFATNRIPVKDHYSKANCGKCKRSLLDTKPVDVDEATMQKFIDHSDLPVIVDFWAPWCGPCRMMEPAFEQAAASFPLKAQFIKLNTENYPQPSARYGIRGIPTMIAFKGGREVDRISGALSAPQISEWTARFA